jgi:hypothetical protein
MTSDKFYDQRAPFYCFAAAMRHMAVHSQQQIAFFQTRPVMANV